MDELFAKIMAEINDGKSAEDEIPKAVNTMLELLGMSVEEFVSMVNDSVQSSTEMAVMAEKMGIDFEPAILVMGMVAEGMMVMHHLTMKAVYDKIIEIQLPEDENGRQDV